jgi:hypothetical protein
MWVGLFSSRIRLYTVYFWIQIDIRFGIFRINQFQIQYIYESKLLVCNNLEINNMINLLNKALFMNWIFKRYFISLSIIEFMNHSEFMTGIVKLHNIEYTFKTH